MAQGIYIYNYRKHDKKKRSDKKWFVSSKVLPGQKSELNERKNRGV